MVTIAAPVYLTPDATRVPLRTIAVGTELRVIEDVGDWLHVEFRDSQYGPRVGYIEKKNVRTQQEPPPIQPSSPPRAPAETTPPVTATPEPAAGSASMACVGQASTPGFAGFSTSFTTGVRSFNGEIGGSGGRGFGLLSAGYVDFSGADATAYDIGGQVGGDVAPAGQRIHACPIGGVTFLHDNTTDVNEVDVHAGGSVGVIVVRSDAVTVIPFAAGFYTHATVLKQNLSGNFGNATAGVGLSFNDRFSVIPEVLFPINTGASDRTFQLRVTFGF